MIDEPEKNKTKIVVEYHPVSLQQALKETAFGFSDIQALTYFQQLISAIAYCKAEHPSTHLDIKLENIKLIEAKKQILMSEFRMSDLIQLKEGEESDISDTYTKCRYMPPEMIDSPENIDQDSIDVWLAGTILYMFITKEYLFAESIPKYIS